MAQDLRRSEGPSRQSRRNTVSFFFLEALKRPEEENRKLEKFVLLGRTSCFLKATAELLSDGSKTV